MFFSPAQSSRFPGKSDFYEEKKPGGERENGNEGRDMEVGKEKRIPQKATALENEKSDPGNEVVPPFSTRAAMRCEDSDPRERRSREPGFG
jgi:hypothetical protein